MHLIFFAVKKIAYILIVSMLVLSSCSVFNLRDKSQHAHLNKVPVNEKVLVAEVNPEEISQPAEIDVQKLAKVDHVTTAPEQPKPVLNLPVKKVNPVKATKQIAKNVIGRTVHQGSKASTVNKTAEADQNIDIVTLLIWVLVISVILALLGVLIPTLWEVFIGLLLVVLIIMAIMYLAGSM